MSKVMANAIKLLRRSVAHDRTELRLLQDLIMDMAGPTVAWAQACARQAGLQPGEFRPDHQELIDRINAALREAVGQ